MRQSVALALVASVGALAAPQMCQCPNNSASAGLGQAPTTETLTITQASTIYLTQTVAGSAAPSVYAAGSSAAAGNSGVVSTETITQTETSTREVTVTLATPSGFNPTATGTGMGSPITITETRTETETETETTTLAPTAAVSAAGYSGAPGSGPITITETRTETRTETKTETTTEAAPTGYGSVIPPNGPHHYPTGPETGTEGGAKPTGHTTLKGHHPSVKGSSTPAGDHHTRSKASHSPKKTPGGYGPGPYKSHTPSGKPLTPSGYKPSDHSTKAGETKTHTPHHSQQTPGGYGPGPKSSEKPHTPSGYKPSDHSTKAGESKTHTPAQSQQTPGGYGPGPKSSEKPHTPSGYKPSDHSTKAGESKTHSHTRHTGTKSKPAGYTPASKSSSTEAAVSTSSSAIYGQGPASSSSSSSAAAVSTSASSSDVYGQGPAASSSSSTAAAVGTTSSSSDVYGSGPSASSSASSAAAVSTSAVSSSSSSDYGSAPSATGGKGAPSASTSSASSSAAAATTSGSSPTSSEAASSTTASGSAPSTSQITNSTCFDTGAGNKDNANTADGVSSAVSEYTCYSGPASSFPTKDKWVSFDEMWTVNAPIMGCWNKTIPQNLPSYADMIKKGIQQVAEASLVDHRVILAQIMQESGGCVNTPTTTSWSGVPNPGMMQTHNGTSFLDGGYQTKSADEQQQEITQMIIDGVQGTMNKPGGGEGVLQALDRFGDVYSAVRYYNSGTIDPSNLSNGLKATAHYSSDIANRLLGWNGNGQKTCPNFICGQGEANCSS